MAPRKFKKIVRVRTPRRERRKIRRMYRKKKPTSLINRTPKAIMPFTYFTRLPYGGTILVNSTSSGAVTQWRLNSLYEPQALGAGHQPRGFDQLCVFYQRYLVYGALVEFQGRPTGDYQSDASIRMVVSAIPVNGVTAYPTNLTDAIENRFSLVIPINTFGSGFRFKKYFDISKIWGNSKRQVSTEENFSASTNANPIKVAMVCFQMFTTSADDVVPYEGTYKITYYTKFYSPVNLGPS